MDVRREFAAAIEAARRRKDISVREVARRSGGRISTTTILNMEGGHVPSSDVIVEYAEALETDPEEARLLADDLLSLAGKRLRYHRASVTHGLSAGLALGRR